MKVDLLVCYGRQRAVDVQRPRVGRRASPTVDQGQLGQAAVLSFAFPSSGNYGAAWVEPTVLVFQAAGQIPRYTI